MPEVQNGNSPGIWNHVPQEQVCLDGVLFQWMEQNKHQGKRWSIPATRKSVLIFVLFIQNLSYYHTKKVNFDTTTATETALTFGNRNTPRLGSHITSIISSSNLTFLMCSLRFDLFMNTSEHILDFLRWVPGHSQNCFQICVAFDFV